MKKCVILVDNSNVYIEGQKFSARKKGIIEKTEVGKDQCDPSWRIDFGHLLSEVTGFGGGTH